MAKNETEKNSVSSSSIADVIAEAEEANLLNGKTVPAQATSVDDQQDDGCDQTEEKKSFGARLKATVEKVKANKKGVIITLAVVGAAAVTVAKFAAKTVVEEVVESVNEEETATDGETQGDSTPDA